jgi:large subunit ribosomal protein L4
VLSSLVEGDTPSTKTVATVLGAISERKNLLIVIERDNDSAWKSVRNLADVHVLAADQLNTYDVLCSDDIVFTQAALEAFLAGPKPKTTEETGK